MYTSATADSLTYRSLIGFNIDCRSHAAPNRAAPTKSAETLEVLSVQPQDKSEISSISDSASQLKLAKGPEWRPFYEHWPVPVVVRSKDFEVWHYGPEHNLDEVLPTIEGNSVKCSGQHLQAIQTAQRTLDSFSADLGRDFNLNNRPLPIVVGHPHAHNSLPFYQKTPFKCIGLSSKAEYIHPDAISHETGHAILDSWYNYDYNDLETAAVHEAFADCCSLLAAWHEPQVLLDILRQRTLGITSNKLTAIGENLGPSSNKYPIRDLSQDLIIDKSSTSTPHEYSQKFTQAFYQCLLDWENFYNQDVNYELKAKQPIPTEISQELTFSTMPDFKEKYQALALASQTLGRHFANALCFLPQKNKLKLSDLSQALLESGCTLEKEPQICRQIYLTNLPF